MFSCWTGVKASTALSQATIAGGGIAGVAVTLHKKHPYDPSRPLIDFDLALMLLPVLLLGVSMGAHCIPLRCVIECLLAGMFCKSPNAGRPCCMHKKGHEGPSDHCSLKQCA